MPRPNQHKVDKSGNDRLVYRTTAIAHNAKGYDLHFIMNYMVKNGCKPDTLIRRGGKILHMSRKASGIRFIDSLSFIAIPLSKFSQTFQLDWPKGDFPHLFNHPDNEDYEGPLPDPEKYGVNNMMPKAREEFLKVA